MSAFLKTKPLPCCVELLRTFPPELKRGHCVQETGNLTKILIGVCGVAGPAEFEELEKLKAGEVIVELLKVAPEGPVQKNVAVALAKMAKHPGVRNRPCCSNPLIIFSFQLYAQIRENRGMEILLQLQKSL